jgi:1,4-alpha-glucan branching enzyme
MILVVEEPIMSDETKVKGMGSIPPEQGVAFRVWAPHAQRVSVIGSFTLLAQLSRPAAVQPC